jgi:hypothetical protein
MMILIVTIAGVGVYAYSLNAISASSDNFSQKTAQYSEQVRERFEILRVWSNDQNLINITIFNYGQTDLSIAAVYLNGTAVQNYLSGKDTTIGTGQLLTVEFTSPLTIQHSSYMEILAVSARGGKTTVLHET